MCEGQESSSVPAPALASSLPGSCTARDAAAGPLRSLPSPHALPSVPKMPFLDPIVPTKARQVCLQGTGNGEGSPSQGSSPGDFTPRQQGGVCLAVSSLPFPPSRQPRALQLLAKSKFRLLNIEIQIFLAPFTGFLVPGGQPCAHSAWHTTVPQGVGTHLGAAWLQAGLTRVLLFAGPWFGTGTTQPPMGSWRWLKL